MTALRMALRMLVRDWRAGELRILALALTVAVGSVTAVGFFTDRIDRAMRDQAAELLGADLVLATSSPIRPELVEKAAREGVRTAITVDFPSVVLAGNETVLVQVKAVDTAYPLRGALKIKERVQEPPTTAMGIPSSGQVWVETRLLDRLDLETGARVRLGDREFTVSRLIDYEPDRAGQLFRLAPRVMMARQDLAATGLVTENSRVRYRLLLAGPEKTIQAYRDWWEQNKTPGEAMQGLRDGRPEIRASLDRAQRFLAVSALVAVLVAGAAIALSARQFVERQLDVGAIMRCLGAGRHFVVRVYAYRLLALGSLAGLMGCAAGYAAHTGLAALLSDWFVQQPPSPGLSPVTIGLATGLVTLAGTTLPAILRLRKVPPLRVLRRDLDGPRPSVMITMVVAGAAFGALLLWHGGTDDLNSRMLLWAGVSITVLWIVTLGLIWLLGRVLPASGMTWRYGLARLSRYPQRTALQVTGFSVGLTALLVLALARVDLLNLWREGLPADTPNHFLINVQRDEIQTLRALFVEQGLNDPVFYPIVRGRLTAIGDRAISADDYQSPRAQRLASREFNLTWTDILPRDNKIIAGQWWENEVETAMSFSVEAGIAKTLGIKLGDTLRYQIAGTETAAPVSSIREVDWDSFNPNFFVIGSPALLAEAPATMITSFYLPPHKQSFISALARQFPSVTDLNVDALMQQVRTLMDRAALAIEYVFLFTILAGLLVLYAAIHTSQAERRRETALFRALGASRRQVLMGLLAEFLMIGVMAGFLAALTASLASYMIATHVFELIYRPNHWLWVWGVGGGGAGIALAGILGTRRLLNQSPLRALQRS